MLLKMRAARSSESKFSSEEEDEGGAMSKFPVEKAQEEKAQELLQTLRAMRPVADEECGQRQGTHVFAVDFTSGDTCLCGAFYLHQRVSGAWCLEPE